jgi:trehalose 6-phosphate phosphatase
VTYLFSKANQHVLCGAIASKALLAFDFDGTLAPLVDDPRRATMRPYTRRLLRRTCRLFPCVVISGRSRADAQSKLQGLGMRCVIGNHGAELHHDPAAVRRRVRRWLPVLRAHIPRALGVRIENKRLSVALHYRQARDRHAARRAVLAAAGALKGVRIVGGALAVNLLMQRAPHKGLAVEYARVRLGCDKVVYIGDDATDEDAFAQGPPERLLSIRVGRKQQSAASHYIRDQREIDRLLEALVALRA